MKTGLVALVTRHDHDGTVYVEIHVNEPDGRLCIKMTAENFALLMSGSRNCGCEFDIVSRFEVPKE